MNNQSDCEPLNLMARILYYLPFATELHQRQMIVIITIIIKVGEKKPHKKILRINMPIQRSTQKLFIWLRHRADAAAKHHHRARRGGFFRKHWAHEIKMRWVIMIIVSFSAIHISIASRARERQVIFGNFQLLRDAKAKHTHKKTLYVNHKEIAKVNRKSECVTPRGRDSGRARAFLA